MRCNRLGIQLLNISAKDTSKDGHNRNVNAKIKVSFDCTDEPSSELIDSTVGNEVLNSFQRIAKANKTATKNAHKYAMRVDPSQHEVFLAVDNNPKAKASFIGLLTQVDLAVLGECVSIVAVFVCTISKETFGNIATYLRREDIIATIVESQTSISLDSKSDAVAGNLGTSDAATIQ